MTDPQEFPYALDKRWAAMFLALGVKESDGVVVTPDRMMRATYGRFSMQTSLDNIDHTEISGPHRWWTAVGPRLSFADSGLTFGTNHRRGLCIAFVEPIPRVLGSKDHGALWVSVGDPEGLAQALAPG